MVFAFWVLEYVEQVINSYLNKHLELILFRQLCAYLMYAFRYKKKEN